ncbi:MAG TPA: DUF1295 domain-containing protein [Methylophaga sp.]|nr:DUF1295 domain-containing protein [Methylophaga sp.]
MLWLSLLVVSVVMLLGWFWQQRTQNAGIVDVLWAFSLSGLAFFYAFVGDGNFALRLVAGLVMGVWYLRLGWHLAHRVSGEAEDGRYQHLRKHWGDKAGLYYFFFFQFQALLAWSFAWPVYVISQGQLNEFGWPQYLGIAVVLVAICGVTVADRQLQTFRENPANKGRVCERGLWYYSRHPNYFFEWLHWFAYPLLATGIAGALWLWLAPLIMLLFLYFVTGIPYTEQQSIRSRGDAYKRYQQTTSPFIPWRKKHVSN